MAYKASISKAWKSPAKHHEAAANAGDMVSGAPQKDLKPEKHSHKKVDDAGSGNQRILTTTAGGTELSGGQAHFDYWFKQQETGTTANYPGYEGEGYKVPPGPKKIEIDPNYTPPDNSLVTTGGKDLIADIPSSQTSKEVMGTNISTTQNTSGGYMDVAQPWQVRQQGKKMKKYARLDDKNVKLKTKYINDLIKKGVDIDSQIQVGNKDIMDALSITGGYQQGGKGKKNPWVSTTGDRTIGEGDNAVTIAGIEQRSESGKALDSGHRENVFSHNPGQYKINKSDYGNESVKTTLSTTSSTNPADGYTASTTQDFDHTKIDKNNPNPNEQGTYDVTNSKWIKAEDGDGNDLSNNANTPKDEIVSGSWSQNMNAGYANDKSVAVRGERKTRSNRRKNKYTQAGPNWHNS